MRDHVCHPMELTLCPVDKGESITDFRQGHDKMPEVQQKGMLGHVAHGHSCMGHSSLRACKGSKAESRNNCGKQARGEATLWAWSCFSCGFTEEGLRVCKGVLG